MTPGQKWFTLETVPIITQPMGESVGKSADMLAAAARCLFDKMGWRQTDMHYIFFLITMSAKVGVAINNHRCHQPPHPPSTEHYYFNGKADAITYIKIIRKE